MKFDFVQSRSGNVALYFCLALVPILSVIGFAADASRQDAVQSELQTAVDMTALATTRTLADAQMTQDQRQRFAKDFFAENFSRSDFVKLDTPRITYPEADSVRIEVSGKVPTAFMGLLGIDEMDIQARSSVKAGGPSVLEAALVLDVSRSMSGQPLEDLRAAALSFVDDILDPSNRDIRISIVPFGHYVNVGVSNRNAPWIDVPADYTETRENCSPTRDQRIAAGCYQEDYTCTRTETDSSTEVSETCQRWVCPDPASVETTCTTRSWDYTFTGCVGSRAAPHDVEDTRWDIDVQGVMHRSANPRWCPAPIQPLTNSKARLDTVIGGLTTANETYIAPAIAWGVRTLTPAAPFSEALDDATFSTKSGKRVMIVMSDGANTRSRDTNGLANHADTDAANDRTRAACDEAKARGIDVYTIAYRLTDTQTLDLLEDCASDPDQAFSADTASDLLGQFSEIGTAIGEMRLTE
ncbi:MAG: hypothetical protein GVY06_04730 [Alphaproteobacteria bacterium]|jgi:Flp pilus assembly protein TadG|nr:hypothetical protein [Alphaproteobacteria bacterium]